MSQQDDRPEDAPTEWLSPALYRQLCDAVDAALFAPPDARDALLAARLGSDQRLLAEARALLASHEASPRTVISPAPPADGDETYIGRPDSETMLRHESATVIVPASASRSAYPPDPAEADGTQEMRAPFGPPGSGTRPGAGLDSTSATVMLRSPFGGPSPTAHAPPRVPIAPDPLPPHGTRPAFGPPVPINMPPPPMPVAPPPMPAAPVPAPPPISKPAPAAAAPPPATAPPAAAEPPAPASPQPAWPAAAPVPAPAAPRASDTGAPVPARRGGVAASGIIGAAVAAALLLLVAGGALWMWRQATLAQQESEVRLAKAEKRFAEVRQLGQRLAEVDRLLAVSADPGAQAARTVLLRTWMQYLTDLQRASGSTERELLVDVAKGYRQLAASLGGISGRTLGDRAGAIRTLQIAENLWSYLDRNSAQPDASIRRELLATHVDLGDLYAVAKDAGKASAQYQKALEVAGRLSAAGVGTADVARLTTMVRGRIQSGPPRAAAPVADATPGTASEEP